MPPRHRPCGGAGYQGARRTSTDTVSDYGIMDTRYAIYFAPPPGSPLKQFADAWLGRDPDQDERVAQPVVHAIPSERLHEITAFPRHYGFHATMKAPFIPAPGRRGGRPVGRCRGVRRPPPAVPCAPEGRRVERFPGAGAGGADARGRPAGGRLRARVRPVPRRRSATRSARGAGRDRLTEAERPIWSAGAIPTCSTVSGST